MGMVLGIIIGLLFRWLPLSSYIRNFFVMNVFHVLGTIFINIIRMMVVPIVLVSLVCGVSSLGNLKKFGRVGVKTAILYVLTTIVAVVIALVIAQLFKVGVGLHLTEGGSHIKPQDLPEVSDVIINMFPVNPFKALSEGVMLQIIVFSLLLGAAISVSGELGEKVKNGFQAINAVLMNLITMIMRTAPYGVFFLLASLFARMGFGIIVDLGRYFFVVLLVLFIQMFFTYPLFLRLFSGLNPVTFFQKMKAVLLFAFSISSSNASIPAVLKVVEERLGVDNSIAAFVIPLGATINMDGTVIMQGVATVFIAHAYHVDIGLTGYFTVIVMATLASIGTAGVPSVGLITLAMVLEQVGLPLQGIALIIGVDRLLDMVRTAVNVSGDSMIACIVGKTEKALKLKVYNRRI